MFQLYLKFSIKNDRLSKNQIDHNELLNYLGLTLRSFDSHNQLNLKITHASS